MNGPFNIEIPEIVNFQNERRQTRTGVTTSVVEEFVETRSDRQVSTNIAQTMRARDITVTGENFKPNTRLPKRLWLRHSLTFVGEIAHDIIRPRRNKDGRV